MAPKLLLTFTFLLFLLLAITSEVRSDDSSLCVYTVYVRTGSVWKGGTDSVISLTLNDTSGSSFSIPDLVAWGGLMDPGHDYYERGDLDIFSGRGPCLPCPPCAMTLTSDGSGSGHGWYCNYVEVTVTGPHIPCSQRLFTVEQWLALDRSPYQLSTDRDLCGSPDSNLEIPLSTSV